MSSPSDAKVSAERPICDQSASPPIFNEAVAYLDQVKNRFADEPERYQRLLQAFSNFYTTTAPDVPYDARVSKIKVEIREILQGHDDLIEGFEGFMPKDLNRNETEAE